MFTICFNETNIIGYRNNLYQFIGFFTGILLRFVLGDQKWCELEQYFDGIKYI